MIKKTVCIVIAVCMISACAAGFASAEEFSPELVKPADHLCETFITENYDRFGISLPDMTGFSCSGVQNGQYRGRNYDWTYADTDLCIIHTTVTEKRPHASVGVADMSFILNEDGSLNCKKLPFVTVDGINDAGVCIQVNVMPFGENGPLNHTDAKDDNLPGTQVVRYVLDYAGSVGEAVSLLQEKDVYSEMEQAEELHWMISGPDGEGGYKTVIIEILPDGMNVIEDFVGGKPIMTNFNVSNFDGTPGSLGIGFGYERWQILGENFTQASSLMGTFDLMEKVFFSKLYDLYGKRFWYSEYNASNLSHFYGEEELKALLGEETYDFHMENFGGVLYTSAMWDGESVIHGDNEKTGTIAPVVAYAAEKYESQSSEDGSLWITLHTSVYGLENLTLDIALREGQDHMRFTIE